jgi:hypothetical protein
VVVVDGVPAEGGVVVVDGVPAEGGVAVGVDDAPADALPEFVGTPGAGCSASITVAAAGACTAAVAAADAESSASRIERAAKAAATLSRTPHLVNPSRVIT